MTNQRAALLSTGAPRFRNVASAFSAPLFAEAEDSPLRAVCLGPGERQAERQRRNNAWFADDYASFFLPFDGRGECAKLEG